MSVSSVSQATQPIPLQKVQVELNFALGTSTATSNGHVLTPLEDPEIELSVRGRDTLEFVSDEAFRIEIEPKAHINQDNTTIPAGPDENPFEKSETDSQLQAGRHKVDRGAVRSNFQTDERGRAYKYTATPVADPNKRIDPHIIIGK
jgi:hypothetical protein